MIGAGDEDEVVNDSSPPFPEVGAGETPLLSTEGKAFSRPRFFVFGVICDSIFITSTLLLLSFVMLMIGTTVVVLRKEGRLARFKIRRDLMQEETLLIGKREKRNQKKTGKETE